MESARHNKRRRWARLIVPLLIAAPFLMSFAGVGTTEGEFCELWGTMPGDNKIKHNGSWYLTGEPVASRQSCENDGLWHYGDNLKGVDAVVWADCQVSWVGGGRSTAEAEGITC